MFSFIYPINNRRNIYLVYIIVSCMTIFAARSGSSNSGSPENTAPVAVITSPLDGAIYTYGDDIIFTGSGTDTEDGDLAGTSLAWTSDIDDAIGTGTSFTLNDLSQGDHHITLTATDGNAETGSDSVNISVKAWTHPAGLGDSISPDGTDAYDPYVAMDDNGNAVIAWHYGRIFMSEYRNRVWTHPADLADSINPNEDTVPLPDEYGHALASNPQVAMDNSGNTIITWEQCDNGSIYGVQNFQIFISEYRDGVWSHPASVTDNINPDDPDLIVTKMDALTDFGNYPQVAMDNNGNAIVVWRQKDGGAFQIFMSEYRDGVWTHPAGLSDNISPDGMDAYNPQVAMDDNGNAIITWTQYDFGASWARVFMSEYRDGAWTHPADLTDCINMEGTGNINPRVAMDNNGNTIIAYRYYDNGEYPIAISEYRDGTWIHSVDQTDNISPGGTYAYDPRVAMDDNGSAIITWVNYIDPGYQIFMSEYR